MQVSEKDRDNARSAVVSAYHALDCVSIPVAFLHAFADAAVGALSTDAEPVKTAPAVAANTSLLEAYAKLLEQAEHVCIGAHTPCDIKQAAKNLSEPIQAVHDALSAQVQDVAESGYSLDKMKAAYIAGYAQGNCLSGTLEGDEEWEEYFSCVVDTASPAPKHGEEG